MPSPQRSGRSPARGAAEHSPERQSVSPGVGVDGEAGWGRPLYSLSAAPVASTAPAQTRVSSALNSAQLSSALSSAQHSAEPSAASSRKRNPSFMVRAAFHELPCSPAAESDTKHTGQPVYERPTGSGPRQIWPLRHTDAQKPQSAPGMMCLDCESR